MARAKPLRIPAWSSFETRPTEAAETIFTDSFMVNAYKETQKDGRTFAVKRVGSTSAYTYNSGGATSAQGTTYYQSALWAMGSNVLYNLTPSGNGSADGSAWSAGTSAPWNGRSNHGCIVFNGQIFIIGGENTGGLAFLNDVWASSDGVNWTQVVSAAPWAKRENMGLAILGTTLYLIGGNGSGIYNDVWSTPDGVNWTQVVGQASWPARNGLGVCSFNQGIWVMGGSDATTTQLHDVWFSPDGATWTQLVTTAAWSARSYFSLLVYQNKMWLFGGINGGGVQSSVYSSSDGINWTNTGSLPSGRELMASCVYANKMWLLGGYDTGINRTSTVWNTTDGVTFTVATSAYGGGAIQAATLVAYQTPTSISSVNAATMWLMGGNLVAGYTNAIYRATLNVAVSSTYTPSGTGASAFEQWQAVTQNAGQFLIWKNTKDAWVYWAGVLQQITSTNYPKSTVFGIANLDDTVYVMDANGVIYGSNLSDPFTWSALNFITADYQADVGVALVKYQNYVVALKSSSMQIFYDAGRYPGSPLLPVIQYNSRIGCVSSYSIQNFNNTVIWVARTEELGPYIVYLENGVPVRISTADIDKLLQKASIGTFPSSTEWSFSWRSQGHLFYGYSFTVGAESITIVYDFAEKEWHIERSTVSVPIAYKIINYVTDGTLDYFQDKFFGILYKLGPDYLDDNGTAITAIGQGITIDAGNNDRKFTTGLTAIGDRRADTSPNSLLIQWSDDDGQTFSTGQSVDLTTSRPKISRTGSFYRRRYRWTHSSVNPMRLESLEQEIVVEQ